MLNYLGNAVLLIGLCIVTGICSGQAPMNPTGQLDVAALKKDGFEPLFNERDLAGWRSVNGNGKFKVEANSIIGHGENVNHNTFLRTDELFRDFELSFEFRFNDRTGNSGLMFRANQRPKADGQPDPDGRVFGYQCEHDQNHSRSWTAGLYDEARRDWLFPMKGDETKGKEFTLQGQSLFRWDDWNVISIRCQGIHIQTWLNGQPRVDFVDSDPKHSTLEGFIALQVHNGKSCNVAWRNLYLKVLHEE